MPNPIPEREERAEPPGLTWDRLTWDRAVFVYEAARLQAEAVDAPVVPERWLERDEHFRAQFMEVIERQMGEMRSGSPVELHGGLVQAYIDMGWRYGPEEQDKDAVFIALCEIARLWIRGDV